MVKILNLLFLVLLVDCQWTDSTCLSDLNWQEACYNTDCNWDHGHWNDPFQECEFWSCLLSMVLNDIWDPGCLNSNWSWDNQSWQTECYPGCWMHDIYTNGECDRYCHATGVWEGENTDCVTQRSDRVVHVMGEPGFAIGYIPDGTLTQPYTDLLDTLYTRIDNTLIAEVWLWKGTHYIRGEKWGTTGSALLYQPTELHIKGMTEVDFPGEQYALQTGEKAIISYIDLYWFSIGNTMTKFVISDIEFRGDQFYDENWVSNVCMYCPILDCSVDPCVSDVGDTIYFNDIPFACKVSEHCTARSTITLISVNSAAETVIENVTFSDIRFRPKGLIDLQNTNTAIPLVLQNIDFQRIEATGYIMRISSTTQPVTLENVNFQDINPGLTLGNDPCSSSVELLEIDQVDDLTIQNWLVENVKNTNLSMETMQHPFYINDWQFLTIKNTTFRNIGVSNSPMIYVVFDVFDITAADKVNLINLNIDNVVFSNFFTFSSASFLYFTTTRERERDPIIVINNSEFSYIYSPSTNDDEYLLNVINPGTIIAFNKFAVGTYFFFDVEGDTTGTPARDPRYITFSNLKFHHIYTSSNLLSMESAVSFTLEDCEFYEINENVDYTGHPYTADERNLKFQLQAGEITAAHPHVSGGLLFMNQSVQPVVQDLNIYDCTTYSDPLFTFQDTFGWKDVNVVFTRNTIQNVYAPKVIRFWGSKHIEEDGYGNLHAHFEMQLNTFAHVQCLDYFIEFIGRTVDYDPKISSIDDSYDQLEARSVIHCVDCIKASIINTSFTNNATKSGVFYIVLLSEEGPEYTSLQFSITGSTFENNSSELGPCDIHIRNMYYEDHAPRSKVGLTISRCNFQATVGVPFYMSGAIHMDPDYDNIISDTYISYGSGINSMWISYSKGKMKILDTSVLYMSNELQINVPADDILSPGTTQIELENFSYIGNNGSINIIGGALVKATRCTFQNTQDTVIECSGSTFQDDGSTFTDNKADQGACYSGKSEAISTFTATIFRSNTAIIGGVIFLQSDSQSNFVSATFSSNYAEQGALIYAISNTQYSNFQSCTIQHNRSLSSLVELSQSMLLFTSSSIRVNYLSLGLVLSDSTVRFENTLLRDCGEQKCLKSSTVDLYDSEVSNVTFTLQQDSIIKIDLTDIYETPAPTINLDDSVLEIYNSNIKHIQGTGIEGKVRSFTIDNADFYNIDSSALNLEGDGSISNSIFRNISLSAARFVNDENGTVSIINTDFLGCSGQDGAAIYAKNVNMTVNGGKYTDNAAREQGGSIYFECPVEDCITDISNSEFQNCSAEQGGAVYMADFPVTYSGLTFLNNSAVHGKDLASYAEDIREMRTTDEQDQEATSRKLQNDTDIDSYNDTDIEDESNGNLDQFHATASGQLLDTIRFVLVDIFDQVVSTADGTPLTIKSETPNVTVLDGAKVFSHGGIFTFDNLILGGIPGDSDELVSFSSDAVTKQFNVSIDFRKCIRGEILTTDETCFLCEEGTYNIEDSDACEDCPSGATCPGGDSIIPNKGYWKANNDTSVLYKCTNQDACLEGGSWETNYQGNLWTGCDDGYYSSANFCMECPDPTVNVLIMCSLGFGVSLVIILLIKSTIKTSKQENPDLTAVYFKILMSYLQMTALMLSFNLDWPVEMLLFFSYTDTGANSSENIVSFDCFAKEDSFSLKIIFIALVPIIGAVLALLVWTILGLIKKNLKQFLMNELVTSIIVIDFLIHPTITTVMFSVFSCTFLEGTGEYWLLGDLNQQCWDDEHNNIISYIAAPALFAWTIGIPTVTAIIIFKNRQNLYAPEIRAKYGFIYNGYNKSNYFWEFVIVYKKICVISIAVFLASMNVQIQAYWALLVAIFAGIIHTMRMPFDSNELNMIELFHIITVLVTFYSGIYFLNDIDDGTGVLMLIITLGVNAAFLVVWVRYAFSAYTKKIINAIRAYRQRLKDAKEAKKAKKQEAIKFAAEKDLENSPEMKEVRFLFSDKQHKRLEKSKRKKVNEDEVNEMDETANMDDSLILSQSPTGETGGALTENDLSKSGSAFMSLKEVIDEEEKVPHNRTRSISETPPSEKQPDSSYSAISIDEVDHVKSPSPLIKRDPGRRNIRIKRKKISKRKQDKDLN